MIVVTIAVQRHSPQTYTRHVVDIERRSILKRPQIHQPARAARRGERVVDPRHWDGLPDGHTRAVTLDPAPQPPDRGDQPTLEGVLFAVGPVPVHGARHDAHAYAASGLADVLADHPTLADLGYVGVEGIDDVPYKRFPGVDLNAGQTAFNTALSKARVAVEHAITHLKTWRMLSEEGGRCRAPLEKYPSKLKAVTGPFFFAAYE